MEFRFLRGNDCEAQTPIVMRDGLQISLYDMHFAFIKLYSGSVWVKKNVKLDNWDTHKLDGFGASVSS